MQTLELTTKVHDEGRQGEAFAPFALHPNHFAKKYYIERDGCGMNFFDGDIALVRLSSNGSASCVSSMRSINNMCRVCVIPFSLGRGRSRDAFSIVKECEELFANGYREVTLVGQNVDSYYWVDEQKDAVV